MFKPSEQLDMRNSTQEVLFLNNKIQITDSSKAKKIKSKAAFKECLAHFARLAAYIFPASTHDNMAGLHYVDLLLQLHDWEHVFEYIEHLRLQRSGTKRGFGGEETFEQTQLKLRMIDRKEQLAAVQSKPSNPPVKKTRENLKRKRSDTTLSMSEKELCRSKSFCIAFNGGTCRQSEDHQYSKRGDKGFKGTLTHKCAKCKATDHGLVKCTQRGH